MLRLKEERCMGLAQHHFIFSLLSSPFFCFYLFFFFFSSIICLTYYCITQMKDVQQKSFF